MSEIIDTAIDVFEQQIKALYTNDYDTFISLMTPRIREDMTIEKFHKAIDLYKRVPIDIDAINREESKFNNKGESEEIQEKHVTLVLIGSGRTLCHVVEWDGKWLIDDIYWRIPEAELEQEKVIEDVLIDEESKSLNEDLDNTKSTEEGGEEDPENTEEDDTIDD